MRFATPAAGKSNRCHRASEDGNIIRDVTTQLKSEGHGKSIDFHGSNAISAHQLLSLFEVFDGHGLLEVMVLPTYFRRFTQRFIRHGFQTKY